MSAAVQPRCCVSIRGEFRNHLCGKLGKVVKLGKHYCGIHDPARIAAKNAVTFARWEAESAATQSARKQREHKLKCFDELLAALIKCVTQLEMITGKVHDERSALIDGYAAIAKATGETS